MSAASFLRRRSIRLFFVLWVGQLLSGLGSGMTGFALGIHVFQRTGRVSDFSYMVLALFLPSILLKPVGGLLADRINRRVLMIASDAGALMSVLALVVCVPVQTAPSWMIYLLVAIGSLFSSFRDPAYKASITDLLGRERYAQAGGMVQLASSAQHLLSPVIAGALVAVGALSMVLIIDAITFSIAIISTVIVVMHSLSPSVASTAEVAHPIGDTPARGVRYRVLEGWRTITRDNTVRSIVLVISGTTLFVGLLQTLLHPMLLHATTADTVGMIQSLAAVGMITSSLVIGTITVTRRYDRMLRVGLIVAGSGMALLGLTPNLIVNGVALFVFFAALPFVNTAADVIIRMRVPNGSQGRVWGLVGFLTQCGYIVAYLSAGVLADHVFEPLLRTGGALAHTVGVILQVGPGRGIGLMIVLSGLSLIVLAALPRVPDGTLESNERYHKQEEPTL